MSQYRVAIIGCGRMGGSIDDEVEGDPASTLPYSHAAGYAAVPRTQLVAIADVDERKLTAFGERWGVAPEHHYCDYRTLIETERPDIVSITTRTPLHAEITLFAAAHGVKGIYCEKAMCCSLVEADAMVEAVERHGVQFNLGTSRRWKPAIDSLRELIAEGRLGHVRSVVSYGGGSLLHTGSHWADLLLCLAGDPSVSFVQGHVEAGDRWDGRSEHIEHDLHGAGFIQFANGVQGYYLAGGPSGEFEVLGSEGVARVLNNGRDHELRPAASHSYVSPRDPTGRTRTYRTFDPAPFPAFTPRSATVRIIEDLIQGIDTGTTTRGNVCRARASTEIVLGFVESHRRGGARVSCPVDNRTLYMTSV